MNFDFVTDILVIIFGSLLLIVLLFTLVYFFIYFVKAERMKTDYIKQLKQEGKDEVIACISYYNHCRPSFSEVFKKEGLKK